MNELSAAIVRWLEQKRGADRTSAAVISLLALGGGMVVFLVMGGLIFVLLATLAGSNTGPGVGLGLVALALTLGVFAFSMRSRRDERQLGLDPMGYWMFRDIFSVGPRLILEALRQMRYWEELGDLNVAACARALTYLAGHNAAIPWQELVDHCPQLPSQRLRQQLSLLDGVLFLGEDGARVTLMEPFRLRLRFILGPELSQSKPEPAPHTVPVNQPEALSPYEILGLSPSASAAEVKAAYRKRVKECHPDLFAGMDQQARALAERWTRALNAAYATLNPKGRSADISSTGKR